MQRWLFKSSSVMIARIWSSWLVHQFNEKFDYAPEGVTKLKLDRPDERIIEALPKFDVVVLKKFLGHPTVRTRAESISLNLHDLPFHLAAI